MFLVLTGAVLLNGCAAMQTAIQYKDLDVQTRMSESIFLDPVSPEQRTVWVEVRNTTDHDLAAIPDALRMKLAAKGYQIVADPNTAYFQYQVNVLYIGKIEQAAINSSLYAGFGAPLAGIGTGMLAGAALTGSPRGLAVGGLVGGGVFGLGEMIAGSLVKAVAYTVITDIQVSVRSEVPVAQRQMAALQQGSATSVYQDTSSTSPYKRYRARVASTAVKVNLDFQEAKHPLLTGLVQSLAGIM